jgi:phosphoglycerate-specific signal transduction histidine kinase
MKKRPPTSAPQDLNDLINEALLLVHDSFVHHSIAARLELSDDVPRVLGDRAQLQQVLLNLVMNGVDALHGVADGPRNLVVASERDGATGEVTMRVSDSGVGIDPALFDRLFDPNDDESVREAATNLFRSMGFTAVWAKMSGRCADALHCHRGQSWSIPSGQRDAMLRADDKASGKEVARLHAGAAKADRR